MSNSQMKKLLLVSPRNKFLWREFRTTEEVIFRQLNFIIPSGRIIQTGQSHYFHLEYLGANTSFQLKTKTFGGKFLFNPRKTRNHRLELPQRERNLFSFLPKKE